MAKQEAGQASERLVGFNETLSNLLKSDKRLLDENGELNLSLLWDLTYKTDPDLIALLLSNELVREVFFQKVKEVNIFKQNDFKFFLESSRIDNSYTAYENRIGLSSGGKFLRDRNEVVLNFPFKDCILAGGQSTEEGKDRYYVFNGDEFELKDAPRKEIFFNQVLAKDEIDRLLEPKGFANIKRYTPHGEEKVVDFTRDESGMIKDNLIIQGNNLVTLHSIKQEFADRVKLIYIDPPYNTGNDSFAYNDNFNHSSWLVFMKNRLEVARDLLRKDGLIFISIDERENDYLRVLCDEIFTRSNRVSFITVKVKDPAGVGQQSLIFDVTEYLLVYAKDIQTAKTVITNTTEVREISDKVKGYKNLISSYGTSTQVGTVNRAGVGEIKIFKCSGYNIEDAGKLSFKEYIDKRDDIAADYNPSGGLIVALKDHIPQEGLSYIEYRPIRGKDQGQTSKVYFKNGRILSFLSAITEVKGKKVFKRTKLTNLWETSNSSLHLEGGVVFKSGKKPEDLLAKIIEFATKEGELVVDFHLGSGTTAAVAHKLSRQYIGIEQIDYGENGAVARLNNVIKGDSKKTKKAINWTGGGSFIYLELAKFNQHAQDRILELNSLSEIKQFMNQWAAKYFLDYNVKFNDFNNKIIEEPAFQKLSLNKQKEMVIRMLDLNLMYVSASEVDDRKYGIAATDAELTKLFYNSNT